METTGQPMRPLCVTDAFRLRKEKDLPAYDCLDNTRWSDAGPYADEKTTSRYFWRHSAMSHPYSIAHVMDSCNGASGIKIDDCYWFSFQEHEIAGGRSSWPMTSSATVRTDGTISIVLLAS